MIFQHLINDIQYFASIHLISDETKEEIKNELFLLADELEELAINGKTADGNRVRIYVSNINFEATYSYVPHTYLFHQFHYHDGQRNFLYLERMDSISEKVLHFDIRKR